ncbi:protoporphyrinogen oxidase [Saccharicrinis fermentans]|uniref:Coproporphyrinogen III oxidase n=1 Tax=Saccharicrinis fermentans DSM 9555 = JCM 21142 TaxID=869213 RepID=W7Y7S6_9BACT|nr:protoporphyrinogen oxidase [Saccharicrinis fermentans]GAF04292.1 protoporphyrinogen oxidase [Saccharicrinis fermentans DSM 9555 = JCM 21142]
MTDKKVDIVVIGAGLTGLTLAFYLEKAGKKVILLEKNERVGGVIHTEEEDGFVYEKGPNTGVISSEAIVQLFDDLKEKCELVTPKPQAKERWILKNGKWEPISSGLIQAITTPLFRWRDKVKILGEPWRKKGTNPDESLAELVKRRMGKSFLDYAVDPFISGIYAGDATKLITRYAMPKLYNLEQNYGSFVKGSIKKKKESKTALQKRVSREIFSAKGGLNKLISALEQSISDDAIFCGCQQIKVKKEELGFTTEFHSREGEQFRVSSSSVVTTFGGKGLLDILPFVQKKCLNPVANITYAKVVQVVLGYKKWNGKKINAFGGLVPSVEKRNILGVLFPGALFDGRNPEQGAILSVFVGGVKKPEMIEKSDDEIRSMVLDEISSTLESEDQPDLFKVFRYENAIPQYDITTKERYEAISQIENEFEGLFLSGNIKDGIGMADRVKQARELSDRLL